MDEVKFVVVEDGIFSTNYTNRFIKRKKNRLRQTTGEKCLGRQTDELLTML